MLSVKQYFKLHVRYIFVSFFLLFYVSTLAYAAEEDGDNYNKKIGLTQEEIAYIKNKKTVLISNEPDYEPYDFSKNGKAVGYSVDFANLLLKDTGLHVKYVTKPWNDLLSDLKNKKIDIVSTIYKLPQKEKIYNYSQGYSRVLLSWVTRKNTKKINRIEELYGKKVGVTKGWSEIDFLNKYPQIQKVYFTNLQEKLQALSTGEIDAVLENANVANYYLSKLGYTDLKVSNPVKEKYVNSSQRYHFVTMKDDRYLISILNKAYDHLGISELQKLDKKWFGENLQDIEFTAEEKAYLNTHNLLNVCVQDNFYPYDGVEGDKLIGVMGEYFEKISKLTNLKFKPIKPSSTQDLSQLENSGKCDLITAISIDSPRFTHTKAAKPFITFHYVMVTSTFAQPIDNEKLFHGDLNYFVQYAGRKTNIQKEYPNLKIEVEPNLDSLMQKLNTDYNAVFLTPKLQANRVVSHYGYEKFKENGNFMALPTTTSIGVRADDKILLDIINRSIDFLEAKDTYQDILDSYQPIQYNVKYDYRFFWYVVGLLFITILFFTSRYRVVTRKNSQIENEKNKLDAILENVPDLLWIKNEAGVYLTCNKRFEDFFGAKKADILGKTDYDFLEKELADFFTAHDKEAMHADHALSNYEEVTFKSDGHKEYLQTTKVKITDSKGNLFGILGIGRDISELKDLNETLEQRVKEKTIKLELALNANFFGYWEFDLEHNHVSFSEAGYKILGYEGAADFDTDTVTWAQRVHPDDRQKSIEEFSRLIDGIIEHYHIVHRALNKEKEYVWLDVRAVAIKRDKNNKALITIGIFRNISVEKQLQDQLQELNTKLEVQNQTLEERVQEEVQKIEHIANHDILTNLPNRNLLKTRLAHSMQIAKRHEEKLGIVSLDLDNFKNINDSYGHTFGDEVIKQLSNRLQSILRDEDTLARTGGDEFVLIIEEVKSLNYLSSFIEKLNKAINEPVRIEDDKFQLTTCIGISIFPDDGENAEVLLKNSDAALFNAKSSGKNSYKYFNETMANSAFERLIIENALTSALQNKELEIYFHPQVSLQDDKCVGFEVLIRWNHPNMGMIYPDKFIPIAEETKQIIPIGAFVLEEAIKTLAYWQSIDLCTGRLAVNVSGVQLDEGNFVELLKENIAKYNINTKNIEIEVTETAIMKNPQNWIQVLQDIKDLGIEISIDDFGTGYSSLSYLKKLPVGLLKIDKSFIDDIPDNKEDTAIVLTIINMAKNLNLKTIAEGVEKVEQKEFLKENGCDYIQGYLLTKPMSKSETEAWLRSRSNECK